MYELIDKIEKRVGVFHKTPEIPLSHDTKINIWLHGKLDPISINSNEKILIKDSGQKEIRWLGKAAKGNISFSSNGHLHLAREVKIGSYVGKHISPNQIDLALSNVDPKIKKHKDFWWFIGYWFGDGNQPGDGKCTVTVNLKDRLTYGRKIDKFIHEIGVNHWFYDARGARYYSFYSQNLNDFLYPFVKGPSIKDIPDSFLEMPVKNQEEFLNGYWAADGTTCVTNGHTQISITSINKKTLEQCQYMFARLGIGTIVQKIKNEGYYDIFGDNYFCKNIYRLNISYGSRNTLSSIVEDGVLWNKVKKIELSPLVVV